MRFLLYTLIKHCQPSRFLAYRKALGFQRWDNHIARIHKVFSNAFSEIIRIAQDFYFLFSHCVTLAHDFKLSYNFTHDHVSSSWLEFHSSCLSRSWWMLRCQYLIRLWVLGCMDLFSVVSAVVLCLWGVLYRMPVWGQWSIYKKYIWAWKLILW